MSSVFTLLFSKQTLAHLAQRWCRFSSCVPTAGPSHRNGGERSRHSVQRLSQKPIYRATILLQAVACRSREPGTQSGLHGHHNEFCSATQDFLWLSLSGLIDS